MNKALPYIFLLSILLGACRKDIPPQKPQEVVSGGSTGKVYVLNEGNFMAANASVTRLDLATGAVVSDIYSSANASAQLGDVLQSMYAHNGKYYLVLNNSNKVEVVDKFSFSSTGTISGLTSPRYFLPVSNSKAYVTDLYSNSVAVIDLPSLAKTSSISINGWTEELCLSYGKVFITNRKSHYVYLIDAATDALTDSILVGYGSSGISEDKNGKLWVLCSGSNSQGLNARLARINPITKSVDTAFIFPGLNNSPFKMKMNGAKDQLYWIDSDGIYSMGISSAALPSASLIPQGAKVFYGLGIDPQDGTVYAADAIDYNQNGKIYRYTTNGTAIDNFSSGIIPGEFFFEK